MGRSMPTIRSNRVLFFLGFFTTVCLLIGLFAIPGQTAGLLIADGGFGGRLEIIEHDVKVTINNNIAVTQVTQIFENMEQRQVEALYSFPVPKGASVSNFSMWIGGKEMIGEVLEKKGPEKFTILINKNAVIQVFSNRPTTRHLKCGFFPLLPGPSRRFR